MTAMSRLRPALLALAGGILLTGCVYVERPAYQPYLPAAPVGPNAGTGAAVGALAGGLIGGAASGRQDRGIGIVGGAAAGALLGGLIGSGIDRDHAAQAEPPYPAPGYGEPHDHLAPDHRALPPVHGAPKSWPDEPPAYRHW
ncbi:glycine zipper domain-containing protein [Roseicella aerolata]|uniref:glycine zipper domain-containing protein n=1 Tax=Roseicella aerolata TaxID=2883479 RepID=UPI0021F68D07|nr:glycine zipper domain-containing protein [Roseicella aerolata]